MSRFGLLRSPLRALRAAGAAAHAEIAGVVAGIGLFADLRDWPRLERLLAPQVELDYTSLFGGQPAALERAALLAQWQALLPGFDATSTWSPTSTSKAPARWPPPPATYGPRTGSARSRGRSAGSTPTVRNAAPTAGG